MGERISEDVIAHCHQCGAPCDTHTNCKMTVVICCLFSARRAQKFNGCCSELCSEESMLPEEEQRRRRAGRENGNKILINPVAA